MLEISDLRIVLGVLAALLNLLSLYYYFRDVFRGHTKPHPFTWFVWGLVSGVVFLAQISNGGGAGAWTTGVGAIACFVIAILSITRGEREITMLDRFCLLGALIGVVLWLMTKDALLAVVFATMTDALGFIPTFRKAYWKPFEETMSTYVLAGFSFILSLGALETYNLTTVLFPSYLVAGTSIFVGMLLVRRNSLKEA